MPGPTHGKVIHGATIAIAALTPVKINVLIGTDKCRITLEVFVIEILSSQTRSAAR